MQPWRIWIESKIHNNSIELAQNNTLNSRIFRLCHHSQFWKPWSPRPPVLLSFAFVHQLSAVFIFVASFGFCLLDHKSNQKKTVHMRGPCCFEMVWNLKYMFFSCFFREVFQAVFGQHGQQHLAVAELKHSSVPTIPSHAPPFVFAQPTARHTSMWCSTPQILANFNNMQQLISNCLLSLVCHTESYCIYYILASPAMDCNLRVLYSMTHSKYQGDPRGTTSVKQSEQLDLSGPFQVEASFSLCQLSLQVFDFLAKVLKGVDGFTLISKGHKKNMSKDV